MDTNTALIAIACIWGTYAWVRFCDRVVGPRLKKRQQARERAENTVNDGLQLLLSKQLDALHAQGASLSMDDRRRIMAAHGFNRRGD